MGSLTIAGVVTGVLLIALAAPFAWRLLREIDELEHLSARWLEPLDLPPAWPDDDTAA